jgi:hypothetical protein
MVGDRDKRGVSIMSKKTFQISQNQSELLPLFEAGSTYITHEAVTVTKKFNIHPMVLIARHVSGDWNGMSEENQQANIHAVEHGEGRIFSSYELPDDSKIWVVTESDRSKTTILLPEEY